MSSLKSTQVSVRKLHQDVHHSLKLWNDSSTHCPLHHLHLFHDAQRQKPSTNRNIANKIILSALEILEETNQEHAKLLRMRFLDGVPARTVAYQLGIAEATANRKQREAIRSLTEILHEQEFKAREFLKDSFRARIETLSYDRLFGVEEHIETLLDCLTEQERPWLISIEGIGGSGKTTLANTIMRKAIDQDLFDNYGWVTAPPRQQFHLGGKIKFVNEPALTVDLFIESLANQVLAESSIPIPFSSINTLQLLEQEFKEANYLIVVDNLETIKDIEELLPVLQRLSEPAKFLLTSRKGIHSDAPIYSHKIPPLNKKEALNLVRYEASLLNLPGLASGSDEEISPIFDIVGGNPLALRLVVGQTRIHTLDVILEDLQHAGSSAAESLYTYIYRYAWDRLDEQTQHVLIAMPFVPEQGGDLNLIAEITGMDQAPLRHALTQLVMSNLVNNIGDFNASRYTIHSLTRTFLQKQVALWQ